MNRLAERDGLNLADIDFDTYFVPAEEDLAAGARHWGLLRTALEDMQRKARELALKPAWAWSGIYVYMYVCMCVCVCVCVYVHICTDVYIFTYIHTYTYRYRYIIALKPARAWSGLYVCIDMCIYIMRSNRHGRGPAQPRPERAPKT